MTVGQRTRGIAKDEIYKERLYLGKLIDSFHFKITRAPDSCRITRKEPNRNLKESVLTVDRLAKQIT